jgi:flavin reductase (DIM6/NTAB) family NADH-FMN oxidoreductase RutF
MIEEKRFRDVMGRFPTGVTLVTTRGEGGAPLGLTVSAFTSVSLDPILVLVCIHREANSHDPIIEGGSFAVNILTSDQADLAIRFSSGLVEERFRGLEPEESPLGNPLLPGSLAWLDCRVKEAFPGGDHSVVLAEVVDCLGRDGDPLLFHRGVLRGVGG